MEDIQKQGAKNVELSTPKTILLAFQHLLAMYAGDILVPLLIGAALKFNAQQMTYLISVDIFMCGVATFLQVKRTPLTGIALPVVLGSAVEYLAPMEHIGNTMGWGYMYGGVIAAGIFVFLISGLFASLRKFFPIVVTGSLITLIGFTLIPVAFQNIGGGNVADKNFGSSSNLILGFLTALVIILIQVFAHGFIKRISVLIGIIVGSVIAVVMGLIDPTPISQAHWIQIPMPKLLKMN